MKHIKQKIHESVKDQCDRLFELASEIFDRPEYDYEEHFAARLLTDYLEEIGFSVERGIADLPTAFRAEWERGKDGPVIGFLGEYDALRNLGHACGHHLQTPICIGAAVALREVVTEIPFKLVIYGTPAEETSGGKIFMAESGCFKELDLAMAYHSGRTAGVSRTSKALQSVVVDFQGIPSHASSAPHLGRSALDAMVLSFHGVECLREHLKDGCRLHYTVKEGTGPSNIIHEKASAGYTLRAPDRIYLEEVVRRFNKVLDGAALMTETSYTTSHSPAFYNTIPIPALVDVALANLEYYNLEKIERIERGSGGSTDFGNVSWIVPSVMISTFYCDAPAHSKEWLEAGKSSAARDSIVDGASVMAATAYDVLSDPKLLALIKQQFSEETKKS